MTNVQWMTKGRLDAKQGKRAAYPRNVQYMRGYNSETLNHAYLN